MTSAPAKEAGLLERLDARIKYDREFYPPVDPLFVEAAALIRDLTVRAEAAEGALRAADKAAEAGLCQFSASAKHEFLRDVRKAAASVGIQGGLTALATEAKDGRAG